MSARGRLRVLTAAALAVACLGIVSPLPASAQISEQDAQRVVSERFDVDVLRVREGQLDGAPVWFVTVMNRGGNFNEAFQVNTLAVDRESGALIPSFRHRPGGGGYDGAGPIWGTGKAEAKPLGSKVWR